MSRRKGELTAARIEREWREQVEFRPENGAHGTVVNAMHDFCRGLDHKTCTLRSRTGEFILLWCFRRAADADGFHVRFGGRRITAPDWKLGRREWLTWKRGRRE